MSGHDVSVVAPAESQPVPPDAAMPEAPLLPPPLASPPRALLEVLARDGSVRFSHAVQAWPLRIGRGLDNEVIVDDPYLAAQHLALHQRTDGTLSLHALGSLNGAVLGRQRLRAGEQAELKPLPEGMVFEAGGTRFRLRLAGETLAPERALPSHAPLRSSVVWLLLFWALSLFGHWLGSSPADKATDWLPAVLGVPLAVVGWCLLWGLLSKLFQGRFEFWAHLKTLAPLLLLMEALSWALPGLAGMFSWAWLSRVAGSVTAVLAVWLLVRHASLVLPAQRRVVVAVGVLGFLASSAIVLTLNEQRSERYFSEPYLASLPPPALRLAKPLTTEAFIAGTPGLKAELDASAARARAEALEDEDRPGEAD
jgi:hypothetical protein